MTYSSTVIDRTLSRLPRVEIQRSGGSPRQRVVLLHGFTQQGMWWLPGCINLLQHFDITVVMPDCPGHGSAAEGRSSITNFSDLIASELGFVHLVGYSMGGRAALDFSTRHRDMTGSTILVGSNPGIESQKERETRLLTDELLAKKLSDMKPSSEELKSFITSWTHQPIFGNLELSPQELALRVSNHPKGLAFSLREWGVGSQRSMWEEIAFAKPRGLFLAGSEDKGYVEIGKRMEISTLGSMRFQQVEGVHHNVVSQAPERFWSAVVEELALHL